MVSVPLSIRRYILSAATCMGTLVSAIYGADASDWHFTMRTKTGLPMASLDIASIKKMTFDSEALSVTSDNERSYAYNYIGTISFQATNAVEKKWKVGPSVTIRPRVAGQQLLLPRAFEGGASRISLINMRGIAVYTRSIAAPCSRIPLPHTLAPGLYALQIEHRHATKTQTKTHCIPLMYQ